MSQSHIVFWGSNEANLLSGSDRANFNTPQSITVPFSIKEISASQKHVTFVDGEGDVYSYGSNQDGRLGVHASNSTKSSLTSPVRVKLPGKAVTVSCGFSHACVLLENGGAFTWGLGDYGALGTGEFRSSSTPKRVLLPCQVVTVSCGAMHTAFLDSVGAVYLCGSNQYGELGLNQAEKLASPVNVPIGQKISKVACGVFYTLVLTTSGRVLGMGNNKYGQLGLGHKINEQIPALIRDLEGVVEITAGYHSGALDSEGNLYIWGSGSFGELLRPKKFVLPLPMRQVKIRGFFGLATGDDRTYIWGNNTYGELGNGKYEAEKEPIPVVTLDGFAIDKVACGVNFIVAAVVKPRFTSRDRPKGAIMKQAANNLQAFIQRTQIPIPRARAETFRPRSYRTPDPTQSYSGGARLVRQSPIIYDQSLTDGYSPSGRLLDSAFPRTSQYGLQRQQSYEPIDRFDSKNRFESNATDNMYREKFEMLSKDYQNLLAKYGKLEVELNKNNCQEQLQICNRRLGKLTEQLQLALSTTTYLEEQLKLTKSNEALLRTQVSSYRATASTSAEIEQRLGSLLDQKEKETIQLLSTHQNQLKSALQSIIKMEETQLSLRQENNALKAQQTHFTEIISLMEVNERQLINTNATFSKRMQTLEEGDKDMSLKVSQLQLKALTLQSEKTALENRLDEAQNEADLYRNELQDQKTQKIELIKEVDELRNGDAHRTSEQEEIIAELKAQLQLAQEKREQLEAELVISKQYCAKVEEGYQQCNAAKDKIAGEAHRLEETQTVLQQRMDHAQHQVAQNEQLKSQVNVLSIKLEEEREQIQKFKAETQQQLVDRERQHEADTAALKDQIKSVSDQLTNISSQLQSLTMQNKSLSQQVSALSSINASLSKQLGDSREINQSFQDKYARLETKLKSVSNELARESEEAAARVEEIGTLKRQITKNLLQIDQRKAEHQTALSQMQNLSKRIQQQKQINSHLTESLKKEQQNVQELKKQALMLREETQQAQQMADEIRRVNEELSRANKEFAENEDGFSQKIQQLEGRLYEALDENKSYTPRYEALLTRNKELDARNQELSEMINKAIEIQAQNYKKTILQEVSVNTNNIIEGFRQEQTFQARPRRHFEAPPKKVEEDNHVKHSSISVIPPKSEPYTELMRQKITTHKKKVGESAHKLADILDLGQAGEVMDMQTGTMHVEDYERINNHMQSLQDQKQQFMSKITAFADKLRIL